MFGHPMFGRPTPAPMREAWTSISNFLEKGDKIKGDWSDAKQNLIENSEDNIFLEKTNYIKIIASLLGRDIIIK